MTTTALDLSQIYKPIQKDLDLFHQKIREELATTDPLLQSVTEHMLQISGKQLRPALAILTARHFGNDNPNTIRLAIAIELLHTATLIHDDIIDGSMVRRNQPSLNAKWGNEVSIICGDYFYARAFSILASMTDPQLNQIFSMCARTMCEGEMKQVETRAHLDIEDQVYLDMISKKTAVLFQAACAAGAYVAGQEIATIQHFSTYGHDFGMAFQIADDCMDIISPDENLGKKAGLDFEKKDPTLPLIRLYRLLEGTRKQQLEDFFFGTTPSGAEAFALIREWSTATGALEESMKLSREYAAKALKVLDSYPDSPYRKSLGDLVEFSIQRV